MEVERKARKDAADAKVALEAEIESLSQALFEEVRTVPMFNATHADSAFPGE